MDDVRLLVERLRTLCRQLREQGQDKIPSEQALAARMGASRYQVRRALSRLVMEGELHPLKYRGYFLSIESVRIRLQRRSSYTALQREAKELPRSDLLAVSLNHPDTQAREALGLAEEESAWMVRIRRYFRGHPVSVTESVIPEQLAPHLVRHFRSNMSLHALLESRYSISLQREYSEVSAVAASPEEAGILALPRDYPLLQVVSVNVTDRGIPVEYAVARFRSDMVTFWATPSPQKSADASNRPSVRTAPSSHAILTLP